MKQHYKMFKKGKNWCCMAIATLSVAVGALSISQHNVNADTTETEASSISTNTENTQNLSENTVSLTTSAQNQDLQTKTTDVSTTQNINKTQDQNSQAAVQNQAQPFTENYAVVSPKAENSGSQNGWQTENGNSYYYRDGQKLTGQQNINGKDYYFNDQGQQQKDYFLNQDNHTYYFQADGTRLNDGFYNNWGHTYYFQADGSRLDNGFYNNWGHTYYFGNDGARLDNSLYTNWGHQYYFGNDGALIQNTDVTVNGKKYHADGEGILTEKNNLDTKVDRALSQRGVPYVWGGNTPAGFDCSGLVQWAYGLGPNYRTTYQQATLGTHQRDVMNAPKGSLLFFGSDSAPYHVAISLGDGTYVHAPEPGDVVKIGYSRYFKPSFFVTL